MEDFRSKSCGDGRMWTEAGYENESGMPAAAAPSQAMPDLRCYSASYASYSPSSPHPALPPLPLPLPQPPAHSGNEVKFKKGKSSNDAVSRNWGFSDPEMQRKKRIASYKVYSVEGKVKGSVKRGFRWLKNKCTGMVHGWR